MLALWKKSYHKTRQHIKKQRHYFADKGPSSNQSYAFSSSHVQMWELDHKEGWAPKNWCFLAVVLQQTLESPMDCKFKPVCPKGNKLNVHWKDWCWSWSSNTLATWCEELISLEKTLMLGKIEDRRRRGWQKMSWLGGITDSMAWVWGNSRRSWRTGKSGVLQTMRVSKSQTWQSNWTTPMSFLTIVCWVLKQFTSSSN